MNHHLILITGASRGFGRCIALALARHPTLLVRNTGDGVTWPTGAHSSIHFALFGRDHAGVAETQRQVHAAFTTTHATSASATATLTFSQHAIDFGDAARCGEHIDAMLTALPSLSDMSNIWLFNNAGTVDPLARVPNLEYNALVSAMQCNVVAPLYLTAALLRRYHRQDPSVSNIHIVNVSSLCAVEPFDAMSVYCAGKAARDMFHRNILIDTEAAEAQAGVVSTTSTTSTPTASPTLTILNYAPGPLNTDMQSTLRDQLADGTLRTAFRKMHAEGTLVDPQHSADVLVRLLAAGATSSSSSSSSSFENGAHVDYYDVRDTV